MSSLSGWYNDVDGISAFVAGVASTLADEKLSRIMPKYCCMETDVFEANAENLCEKFSERIHTYEHIGETGEERPARKLDFVLEGIKESPQKYVESLVCGNYGTGAPKCDMETARGLIGSFFEGIRFQLGNPTGAYSVKMPMNKTTEKVFSNYYVYIVFSVLFVEYEDYYLMMAFGSNE